MWKRHTRNTRGRGILYGSTARGIALNLGISLEEAESLINTYFSRFPRIRQYIEDSHAMCLKNQFVTTPFGHIKRQFGAQSVYRKTAVFNAAKRNSQNVRIQSVTAIAALLSFAELNKAVNRIGGKTICTVHDSIEIEVERAKAAQVANEVFRCLNDWPVDAFDFLDLPIGCDVEIGNNWGEVRKLKRGCTQEDVEATLAALGNHAHA